MMGIFNILSNVIIYLLLDAIRSTKSSGEQAYNTNKT